MSTPTSTSDQVRIGYQAFVADGGEEFGAVRQISGDRLIVYVENAGDFVVLKSAITAVHSQKVIFNRAKLDPALLKAIGHAHDAEEPHI